MSRPLFEHWPELRDRIRKATRLWLITDFDGTLAPLVRHPAQAQLAPAARHCLHALAGLPNVRVAVVSGRGVEQLRSLVHVDGSDGIVYSGNHGLEIWSDGMAFVEPRAAARRDALKQLATRVASRTGHIPGVWVEFKGLTASVHFREAAEQSLAELGSLVIACAAASGFTVTTGRKVYEIRPHVGWHKGTAARWIVDSQEGLCQSLVIAAGDDATDEDMFSALSDGVTIKIGEPHGTAARYYVAGSGEFFGFLGRVLDIRSNPRQKLSGES